MSRVRTLALVGLLGGCRIATVRPLESNGTAAAKAPAFDAASYVESIWNSRVIPSVERDAVECGAALASLKADPGRSSYLVKGSGTVVAVDRSSRNGLLALDLEPPDGKPDVWVQIGPVVPGMALRDAVGFISFDQFVNQIDYADAGNALNQRILDSVLKGIDAEALMGKVLSFAGALTPGERMVITPVRLSKQAE